MTASANVNGGGIVGIAITHTTPEETANRIKEIARVLREQSALMRDTMRTLHRSGAIQELTEAVRDAVIAARDASKEISYAAKELNEHDIIKDTAVAIEQTARVIKEKSNKTTSNSSEDVLHREKQEKYYAAAAFNQTIRTTKKEGTIQTNDVKINASLNQEDRREQLLNQAQKKLMNKRKRKRDL